MGKIVFEKDDLDFLDICGNAIHPIDYKQEKERNINWKAVFDRAITAKLLPLVYNESHKAGITINNPDYTDYSRYALSSVAMQIKRNTKFKETYAKLLENGIVAIVTKGIICRSLLKEKSCMRPSKDEDLLIKIEDYDKVDLILRDAGFELLEDMNQYNRSELAKIHEIHYIHKMSHFEIEIHFNSIGHKASAFSKIDALFSDVFEKVHLEKIEYEKNKFMEVYSMDYTNHLLFIFFHAYRHFFTGGFGLRQVLDVLLFFEYYQDKIDFEYIENKLTETNTKLLFNDMIHIGNEYLNFSLPTFQASDSYDDLLSVLLNIIKEKNTQAYNTALPMIFGLISDRFSGKKVSKKGRKSILLWINTIFPSYNSMKGRFPEINKKPWLLPYAWIKRIIIFRKHSKEFDGNLSKKATDIVQMRINLLQKYKMI